MLLITPLPGGTVEGAREHLVNAQASAAAVSNKPDVDTVKHLTEGISSAKKAAAELFLAPPRSEFQDLVAARQQVLDGSQLLKQAFSVLMSQGGVDVTSQVQQLASQAFNTFENVFEILDND